MFSFLRPSPKRISQRQALPDNAANIMHECADTHCVTGNATKGPWPEHLEVLVVGMGCFWGAERKFFQQQGVWSTQVGYAGGYTRNPTYKQVCSGMTDHTEVVQVVFDPSQVSLETLLKIFWENHDPTQGNRQGNDVGTQYRSVIFTTSEGQLAKAIESCNAVQEGLRALGYGDITTEIEAAPEFFYAEDYHQQYLQKNPNGYCGLRGTGVQCVL